jgi:hypothetical protein
LGDYFKQDVYGAENARVISLVNMYKGNIFFDGDKAYINWWI